MKSPINSSYNDFGIIFEGKKERGYFTTDRPGGRGSDDIWSFRIPSLRFVISGNVTRIDNGDPVVEVSVKLIGTDGSTVEMETDELGYYEFSHVKGGNERYVKNETSYTLEFSKKGYLKGSGQETTLGRIESTLIVHDVKMQSILEEEIRFPEVRYDLAKWELQVNDSINSKDSLDFLLQMLRGNPTLVIELMSHTDARGSDESNIILSQKRAQSCVNYLMSRGIAIQRLSAQGYGESRPVFDEAYINDLPSIVEQEAAHQKNRRTTFRVLRDDYVPASPDLPSIGEAPNEEER